MITDTKVTAKMIARQLGLSIATVDRALNNRGNVKKATYEAVMEKARDLKYEPNKLARSLSKKEIYRVALIYPRYIEFFWNQVENGFKRALSEVEDYGLRVDTYRSDSPKILAKDLMKDIIDSGNYQGIAVSSGEENLTDMINSAIDQGIQVCTFNMDAHNSKRLFHVGADYREAGKLAGELICKCIGKKGNVAIFGLNDDYQTREKNNGFLASAARFPDVHISGSYPIACSSNRLKVPEEVLDDVDAVYVSTAELFEFANYLSEGNQRKDLVVVGHDLNDQMVSHLENGIITAVINQDPSGQGYYSLYNLFHYLAFGDKSSPPDDIKSKLEIVMKENVQFYI